MDLEKIIKDESEYNLDFQKISNKIDYKKYKSNANIINEIISFISFKKVLTLIYFIFIGFIIVNVLSPVSKILNNKNTTFTDNFTTFPNIDILDFSLNIINDEFSLLSIASHREFEDNNEKKITNTIMQYKVDSTQHTINSNNISYSFEYVEIISAIKFNLLSTDIVDAIAKNIIEENCGIGILEVVIAKFNVYENVEGKLCILASDTMLSFKGENGYYTVLANGGVNIDDGYIITFSSHKKLLESSINKDFTPPILTIFFKIEGDDKYIYFKTSDKKIEISDYNHNNQLIKIKVLKQVSKNTIYSIYELSKLPIMKVELLIKNVDVKNCKILVSSVTKLNVIYFTNYTNGVSLFDLKNGDRIIVEYDYLYNGYNPISVKANSIYLDS